MFLLTDQENLLYSYLSYVGDRWRRTTSEDPRNIDVLNASAKKMKKVGLLVTPVVDHARLHGLQITEAASGWLQQARAKGKRRREWMLSG